MARTQGTFSLSANIEVAAGAPLDARDRVSAKSDLTASGAFPYHWIGMETYVVAENKKYRLIGSDPTVLANWEEVGSGGSGGASDLNDLDDVNITSATNGQVLKYDSQNQVWVNANESGGGGASDLNDLDDVNITSATNGQVLKYDSQNQEWVNANEDGGTTVVANPSGTATTDLTKLQVDNTIYGIPEGTTVVANPSSTATADLEKLQVGSTVYEVLEGTTVVANPSGTATADLTKLQVGNDIYSIPDEDTDTLEDLTDVDLTSVANGQVLKYDSTSGKWVNANESGGGSGHTIEDPTGTDMTARTNLQFKGAATVSDDSTNDRTIVDVPKMTAQDLEDILTPLPSPVTAPEVGELSDVNLTSLANGQILKYDAANQEWINANESGGGASDLDDLDDVNITSPTSGQVLKYDSQNQEWINANDEGGTTVVANPSGTATADLAKLQVGTDIYGVPDTDELSELTDVNITSASNGQVLKYDSASSKWINANESGGSGHTIENASGTDMTARANLQFTGGAVSVSDDSTNDRTVVTVPDVMASTDMSEIISPLPMPAATPDLEDLGDININTPTNGQVLKYDSQNQEWINANESGGGAGGHTIEDGTGTSMTERASLQFKGAAQVSDDSTNDRTVVDVPKMTAEDLEDILTPLPSPVTTPEVGELSDVNLTSLADGQVLKYDSTNQEWVNANESGGTTVVANPEGEATDELSKLQVGETIYEIVGGGGSGSGKGRTVTKLYDTLISSNTEVTLSDDITNYDELMVVAGSTANKGGTPYIIDVNYLVTVCPYSTSAQSNHIILSIWDNMYNRMTAGQANNKLYFYEFTQGHTVNAIYGIKYHVGGTVVTSGEIIPIENPTDTTSRTFTFSKTPKRITASYNSSDSWYGLWNFIWGDEWAQFTCKAKSTGVISPQSGLSQITYGSDGKSFTITGANSFQALNSSGGYGQMYVDYGEGGGGGLVKSYVVGQTPYAVDWLSDVPHGSPLTPNETSLYLVLDTDHVLSAFIDNIVRYDANRNKYKTVMGNGLVTLFTTTNTFGTTSKVNTTSILVTVSSVSGYEGCTLEINSEDLILGEQYVFNADFQLKDTPSISTSYSWCFGIESTNITSYSSLPSTTKVNLPRDMIKVNLSLTFTAAANNYLVLYLSAISRANLPIEITNITISESS